LLAPETSVCRLLKGQFRRYFRRFSQPKIGFRRAHLVVGQVSSKKCGNVITLLDSPNTTVSAALHHILSYFQKKKKFALYFYLVLCLPSKR
jgi:hypothetical protein